MPQVFTYCDLVPAYDIVDLSQTGSGISLSPVRRQAITRTTADSLPFGR